jgi:hypothetical protein
MQSKLGIRRKLPCGTKLMQMYWQSCIFYLDTPRYKVCLHNFNKTSKSDVNRHTVSLCRTGVTIHVAKSPRSYSHMTVNHYLIIQGNAR